MEIQVLPYLRIDGIPTFRDSQMLAFYDKMERDGVVGEVFCDGEIGSRDEFLIAMTQQQNMFYAVRSGDVFVGVAWLNNFYGKTAQAHFVCFSEAWGKKSVEAMRHALNELIHLRKDGGYAFDVFLGWVPSANERAIEFCRKCGGVADTVVPHAICDVRTGKSVDAVLVYYTREEFRRSEHPRDLYGLGATRGPNS